MTEEAQRIAIAEVRGWTLCQPRASLFSTPWLSGMNPNPDKIVEVIPCDGSPPRKPNESDYGFETLPNYPNDLNAIHEVIEHLRTSSGNQFFMFDYHKALFRVVSGKDYMETRPDLDAGSMYLHWLIQATAAQRVEAVLRALNLYQD